MSQDVAKFIAVVGLHFPPPKQGDEGEHAAWCASMVHFLKGYSGDVLAEAAQRIIRERDAKRDGRFFPVPSTCIEVCEQIARLKQMEKTPLLSSDGRDPSPYAGWRFALADDLMKGATGQRALKEGWQLGFYNFVRDHGRAPGENEIAQIRGATVDEAYAKSLSGSIGAFAHEFVKKAEQLRARVLGEKAA